ncbi:MAG: Uncharacterised protein [Cellulomonadaceae bacterium TMED98]|nr:MAG: Uncharacterised protein [Cellulomonadaceae bacterium TMED98]
MNPKSLLSRIRPGFSGKSPEDTSETEVSSFPFVSGDTFLQMAGHVFKEEEIIKRSGLSQSLCFVSAPVSVQKDFVSRAERFCSQEKGRFTLLIHNGDRIPSTRSLEQLGQLFSRVYCVNVITETSRVSALPIGLENARLNHNGRLGYYLEGLTEARSTSRSRLVVSSFHPSNNPSVREPLANLFRRSRFGFDGHSWKRKEYRDILKQTCFVISPPGNGPDCHRTWEAIYMGAVPVVLRQQLAKSLYREMPILVVESYEEFVEMSDDALHTTYSSLVARKPTKALAPAWIAELA